MNEVQPNPTFKLPAQVLAAGLIIAAIFMGGATERVPQGIVLATMGVLILIAPPAAWADRKWTAAVLGLLALAAVATLPAGWFYTASWRSAVSELDIVLPATLSPQPRVTLEAWLLLGAGITWMGWLMASPWDSASRRIAAQWFVCGMLVLAVVVLVQWRTGWRPPGWLSAEGHGPFPNRNHTAHVLALGAVLAVGCAADAMRRGLARVVPWLLAACVILAALATTYSRGGIIMVFWALGLWNVSVAWTRKSWKILLLGLSALFFVASAMLVFGGPVAARFAGTAPSGVDFRFRIWSDAFVLAADSPWCGAGLGNFAALFPFYRTASVIQSSVIHPESDWLWLVAEAGWLAAALALAAVAFALAGAFPNRRGTQRRLRSTALAASLAAVLHGFVDVPGHRLGSVLAALFVMVLARRDVVPLAASRAAAAMWRTLGLALVLLAMWWLNVPDDEARAEALSREGKFSAAADRASRAIAREPLGWRAYFTRAVALGSQGKVLAAVEDFRRARLLEPHHTVIPIEEGRFWLGLQPELAFVAWEEALRRTKDQDAREIFAHIGRMVPDDAAFRARLLGLVAARDPLQIDWFLSVPAEEARPYVAEFAPIAARCGDWRRAAFERRAAELVPPARP
ncbi:MAG: O-antigen ligase family protein [Chthoniobacteraceae bacterium]